MVANAMAPCVVISTHDIDCTTGNFLSYMRKDFYNLCPVSQKEWYKL